MIPSPDRQQLLWHNQQQSWLDSVPVAPATSTHTTEDMLVVEAIASQISVGTERLVISTALPQECIERMRIPYMQGTFAQAFTYGYSLVGKVREGPAELLGRRVHLLHPHQPLAVVSRDDATLIPDELDTDKATLISNMETAVTAIWDAQPVIGDKILVFGFGLIGTLVSQLLRRIPGLELTVIEPDDERAAMARASGLTVLASAEGTGNADIAFSTAAHEDALQSAIDCLRAEGTVVELSWFGNRPVSLLLGGSFHYDRKKLISSQVSQIPARHGHWDFRRRKELVIRLLQECSTLPAVEQRIAFTDAPEFYARLRQKRPAGRHIVIDY